MFHFQKSPLRMEEVNEILAIAGADFEKDDIAGRIPRNITCRFRADRDFDFPNYLDVLSFCLERFSFVSEYEIENKEDVILTFIDKFAFGLEGKSPDIDEFCGPVTYEVTRNLRLDPFQNSLRQLAIDGEFLLTSKQPPVELDKRNTHCCSVAVSLYHRTIQVFYRNALVRTPQNKIQILDQRFAVHQGKLHSYFPGISLLRLVESIDGHKDNFSNAPLPANFCEAQGQTI